MGSFRFLQLTAVLAVVGSGLFACSHFAKNRTVAGDSSSEGKIAAAWVGVGPDGQQTIRVLVSGGTCPAAVVDSTTLSMQVRVPSSAEGSAGAAFPLTTCELSVPAGAEKASVGSSHLPLLGNQELKKILILGDTGCRIKKNPDGSTKVQDCNSPSDHWPFGDIAKAASQMKPDLVIHVGDYHYREAPCPAGDQKCTPSPFGDTWDSWNADFFTPATPLLAAAPWIFVRGNHESCDRAGEGYFRFLDPRPFSAQCQDQTPPYRVKVGSQEFAVLDSSAADVTAPLLAPLASLKLKSAWLLSHRPIWVPEVEKSPAPKPASPVSVAANEDLSDDDDDDEVSPFTPGADEPVGIPSGISAVFAGHRHLFRVTDYADSRPVQVVSGNGGTLLEKSPPVEAAGAKVDSTTIASSYLSDDFGFLVLDRQKDKTSWNMTGYDKKGKAKVACQMIAPKAGGNYSASCKTQE